MKPEVRRFVEAQKRKKIITVEQMYLDDYERAMRCVIVALANEFGKERVSG